MDSIERCESIVTVTHKYVYLCCDNLSFVILIDFQIAYCT